MPSEAVALPPPTANPRKTRGLRPLGAVDVAPLRAAVLALDDSQWASENAGKPNRFQALGETQHMVFRFVSDVRDWRQSYDRPPWPAWRALVEPVLHAATRAYGYARGAYPRILLARMPPGGVILPHVDANPAALWPHKIHVPLTTNARVGFFIDPHTHHLEVGQAYEVNNLGLHAVRNDGDTQRIHLIFEYYDLDQPLS